LLWPLYQLVTAAFQISDFEKVGKAWLKVAADLKTEGAFAPAT
jgi:hypothetical protein